MGQAIFGTYDFVSRYKFVRGTSRIQYQAKDANAEVQHASPRSRREILSAVSLAITHLQWAKLALARDEPQGPKVGACVECIGEVNGGLNACTLSSPSCVSTQNDDEAHFIPPWQYNGDMRSAVKDLTNIITEGARMRRGRGDEQAVKAPVTETICFLGRLESQHTIDDGSEYLHFVLGTASTDSKPGCRSIGTIDAEFIFLSGDNIVDVRTSSREDPGLQGGTLSLSLSYGIQYDKNLAKRIMEEMRKALHWEQTPVVTDFDPRFNQRRPLFFERLYQPFLREKQDFEDIVDK